MYRKQVRRRRAVLTLLILGSFLLLTISYGRGSGSIQDGVSTIFSPLEKVADRALKPARDLVDWFDKTFEARGENSRLSEELEQARTEAVAGQEAIQENSQLRKLLELDRDPVIATSPFDPVTGRVIARSPTVWHSSVTIDLGSGDGVVLDDPVISGDGLAGEISAVQPNSSQVQLISDHASAVSGKVLPLGVQGVVRPSVGDPEDLVLDFINSSKRVSVGQTVVTSGWRAQGLASLFPPGIPIGEVTKASVLEQEASQQVHLRPFADLANLDMVQVLTGGPR
ncbi:MAG TPA: rod shape-determining protein MreC [Solirubrobacterales bacterium]